MITQSVIHRYTRLNSIMDIQFTRASESALNEYKKIVQLLVQQTRKTNYNERFFDSFLRVVKKFHICVFFFFSEILCVLRIKI